MSEITWEPSEKHEDCLNGYTTSGSLAYVIFCEDAGFRLINYKAGLATMGVFASEEAAKEAAEAHEAPDEAGSQPAHIPPGCRGEACTLCGAQALHKVAEERDSLGAFHGSTAYLCEGCFARVMRPWAPRYEKPEPAPAGSTAAIVDGLRKMADDLSGRMLLERIEGFLVTRDWSDEAKQCAAAADHIEDLAARRRPTPEPPPPGSTAEAFDILRRAAEILCYPYPLALEDLARLGDQVEGAVDHIEDLTDKLEADLDERDQDVTRLQGELLAATERLAAAEESLNALMEPGSGDDYGIPDNELVGRLRAWSKCDTCTLSALVERAAEVLATAETDIARLNLVAESAMANLNAVSAWLDWARSLQASGGQMLTPAGLLQAYPGTLLAIHPDG